MDTKLTKFFELILHGLSRSYISLFRIPLCTSRPLWWKVFSMNL